MGRVGGADFNSTSAVRVSCRNPATGGAPPTAPAAAASSTGTSENDAAASTAQESVRQLLFDPSGANKLSTTRFHWEHVLAATGRPKYPAGCGAPTGAHVVLAIDALTAKFLGPGRARPAGVGLQVMSLKSACCARGPWSPPPLADCKHSVV